MINVVIVDDEPLALDGLERLVNEVNDFHVCFKAPNGLKAFDYIKGNLANIIITDIRMPNYDGMWLINKIEENSVPIAIIVLSAYDDKQYLLKAIKSPYVCDYVTKPFIRDELIEILKNTSNRYYKLFNNKEKFKQNIIVNAIFSGNVTSVENIIKELLVCEVFEDTKTNCFYYGKSIIGILNKNNHFINAKLLVKYMDEILFCIDNEQVIKTSMTFFKKCSNILNTNKDTTLLVKQCLLIASDNIANPDLNLNMIADQLNVTPNYLSNRFSRDMNTTFSNYLTTLRINQAKKLLLDYSYKVFEIGEKVGYSDKAYFNKVFKDKTGETPKQFRERIISNKK